MRVELDIFSGRPNPVWMLDAPAVAMLAATTATLAAAGRVAPVPPDLGYRGLLYAWRGQAARAFRGYAGPVTAPLADPDQVVERLLLSRMPPGWDSLRSVIADARAADGDA